jgi:hypothetical protein
MSIHRIGCESCGTFSGCVCNSLRECEKCGADFLPSEGDEGTCFECAWDEGISYAHRTSPANATDATGYVEDKGKRKARPRIKARFVNLTAKQKALAKRLAYLIVVGDYGRGF